MALASGVVFSGGKTVDADEVPVVRLDGAVGGATLAVSSTAATASAIAGGSTTATGGTSATLIAANSSRKGLQVTVDTAAANPVYLLLGAGTASATNFHVALAAGGSWDGLVGQTLWTGLVVAFSAGTPKIGVAEV